MCNYRLDADSQPWEGWRGIRRGGRGLGPVADLTRCGPVLEVHIDRTLSVFGEGLFQFLLYDHGAYARAWKNHAFDGQARHSP